MYDVVTFGESMIRLTPPNFQRLEQTHLFEVGVSGAELNTATGLSRLGLRCRLWTLPRTLGDPGTQQWSRRRIWTLGSPGIRAFFCWNSGDGDHWRFAR